MTSPVLIVLAFNLSALALAVLWWGCCRRDRDDRKAGIKRHQ